MNQQSFLFPFLFSAAAFAGITPNLELADTVYLPNGAKSAGLSDNLLYTQVSDTAFAFNVGAGHSKLFVTWQTTPYEAWANDITISCGHSEIPLSDFKLLASANSTTGFDGDWDTVATIQGNPVSSRGALVNFTGKTWLRFSIAKSTAVYDARVFDASNGTEDTWFFLGTSITQMAFNGNAPDTLFAQHVTALVPTNTPAVVFGGVGCVNSTEIVSHISTYMAYAGNVHFWAIEMGTNDVWGGGDWNLATYISNMQTIIDSAKGRGITPVIARIPATDSAVAGWQVNAKVLTSLDSLIEANDLPSGPDLFNWFKEHPEEHNTDGVHPNEAGAASIQRLWAQAVVPLYSDSSSGIISHRKLTASFLVAVRGNRVELTGLPGGNVTASLFSFVGQKLETHSLHGTFGMFESRLPHGTYILQIKSYAGIRRASVRL
jgi:lysophospholipase L1-like esterase